MAIVRGMAVGVSVLLLSCWIATGVISNPAQAACADLPLALVVAPAAGSLPVTRNASVFYDQSGRLGLDDVADSDRFSRQCDAYLAAPAPGASLWLRLVLESAADSPSQWVLSFDTSGIDDIRAFQRLPDGRVTARRAGRIVPPAERSMTAWRPAVAIDLPPAQRAVIHVQVRGVAAPTLSAMMLPTRAFQAGSNASMMVAALFYGFLIAVIGFSSVIFYNAGIRYTGYYILYVFFVLVNTLFWNGVPYRLSEFAWSGGLANRISEMTGTLAGICLLQFGRQVLRLSGSASTADRIVILAIAMMGGAGLLAMFDPVSLAWPLHVTQMLGALALFTLSVQLAVAGYPPARPFALSFLCLFGGIGLSTWLYYLPSGAVMNATGASFFLLQPADWAFYVGICGEALFMAFALSALIRLSQRETAQAHAAAQADLARAQVSAQETDRKLQAVSARVAVLQNGDTIAGEANGLKASEARLVEAATEYVQAHIDDPDLGVKQLAEGLAVSEQTLRRRLKNSLGLTPAAFVRAQRLERARQLLASRSYDTVAQVTYAVGFASQGHFARLYREAFGQTPNQTLRGDSMADGIPPG